MVLVRIVTLGNDLVKLLKPPLFKLSKVSSSHKGHADDKCPAKDLVCFDYRITGHISRRKVCSKNKESKVSNKR